MTADFVIRPDEDGMFSTGTIIGLCLLLYLSTLANNIDLNIDNKLAFRIMSDALRGNHHGVPVPVPD